MANTSNLYTSRKEAKQVADFLNGYHEPDGRIWTVVPHRFNGAVAYYTVILIDIEKGESNGS